METTFKTKREALRWIHQQGGKVSMGKFYQDCAKGAVAILPDGRVGQASVAEYMLSLRSPAPTASTAELAAEKRRLEVRRLELEVAKLERAARRDDLEWMRTDDAWAAIAALMGSILEALRHHFHRAAPELIRLFEGDLSRDAELYEQCEQVIGRAMAEIGPTIEGVFVEDAETEQQEEMANPE